jgi:adenylate cyclase
LWHLSKASAEDNALAENFFQRAIDLDPIFAGGYAGLAAALNRARAMFETRDPAEAQSAEEAAARRAVALDGGDAEARSRLAHALNARGDHQGAQAEAERALAICPNLADAHGALGVVLADSGRPKEGLAALKKCIRLDPRAPSLVYRLSQIAWALYFCHEYAAAVEAARQAIRSYPDRPGSYSVLAAALGQIGRTAEAKEALEKAIMIAPARFDNFVRGYVRGHVRPRLRPEDHAHIIEGLRKAGLPEE